MKIKKIKITDVAIIADPELIQMKEAEARMEHGRVIKTLNDAVKEYLCKTCGGEGAARKPDAAGQMEDCRCPACNGTGVCSS